MSDRRNGEDRTEAAAEKRRRSHRTRMLNPADLEFDRTSGGFVTLTVRGEEPERYERINAFRTFPLSAGDQYLSLRDREGDEIGVVESIEDLAPAQAQILRDELERRYFTPLIKRVESLKEEFGYSYWLVDTDAGPRRFTVQSGKNNVTVVGERRLLIVDVDGNRFFVDDYHRLDRNVLKTLETLL
jgi:hypothetical protein